MMEYIPETPDISEEERSFDNSNSIVDSSMVLNNTSRMSTDSIIPFKKKSARIIDSDSSDIEDESICDSSVGSKHDESYRDVVPLIASRSPCPTDGVEKQTSHILDSDASDNEEEHISDHSDDNFTGSDRNQSYRDVVPLIASRSPCPTDGVEKQTSHILDSDTSDNEEEHISDHSDYYSTGSDRNQSYRDVPIIVTRSPSPTNSVIDINSDDEESVVTVTNHNIVSTENLPNTSTSITNIESLANSVSQKSQVSLAQYHAQQQKIQESIVSVTKMKNFMRAVDINKLPDKGKAVTAKMDILVAQQNEAELKLQEMVVVADSDIPKLEPLSWNQLKVGLSSVEPRTFGRQALQTLNVQKALTLDRLEQLHGSLKSCPNPDTLADDPNGLKVELMVHQKHALAWLMWREGQKPSGGILADDMGLGKTLTMIALTLKMNESQSDENTESSSKYPGHTLVICPATLIYQWQSEIKKHVKKGLLTVEMYHGADRETRAKRLSKHDIVITTYALVMGDYHKEGPLFKIKWRRIILDEAHQVRNYKSKTCIAICGLYAKSRWTLTGTPIHNKELDLYALLKFLRCSPFDDLTVWKRWVANKATGGQDRLNTVMSSILLRRTKEQLEQKKLLNCLPTKTWTLVEVSLEKQEMDIYQKVLIFSKTLFAQFLYQRSEKNGEVAAEFTNNKPNQEYFKMHQRLLKLNRVRPIRQHEILVLLLRLRQICCHPSLISQMLQGDENLDEEDLQGHQDLNLLEQLSKLTISNDNEPVDPVVGESEVGLAEASRNLLNPSHPVFAENRQSSKTKVVLKLINESIENGDKIIVISQWKKVLDLLTIQLNTSKILYYQLDGSVPVSKRMGIVENINSSMDKTKVLLLSLTAGGVGLNLVGANRLLLLDLHWNPQLEIQAQDRIYRVGQTKPVLIYKIIAVDTIEERIKQLQDKKMGISNELLSGAKIQEHSKLSLQDLKMLFNM